MPQGKTMYMTRAFAAASVLTPEKKKQIRRNEQIRQEHYSPPQVFRLLKVGNIKSLSQGDTVLGKVKIVTTKKIACQVIYIEFRGVANVDFNVPSTTMIDEIQNFKKEWEFFNHKIPIFMHEQRGYNFLEPGIYEFFFKARVPIGGPCTFLTDIASVTYLFSGVFVRNDVTVDVMSENTLTFHVCGYKDINPYEGARIGFWQEKITHVGGFLGLFRGTVEIRMKTDKRAFVPGEKIEIVGEVVNTTWRKCQMHYQLLQIVKMWGDHYFWRSDKWGRRHLKDELVMERGKSRTIESGQRITLNETLLIPKGIEPSYLGMAAKDYINELINLQYRLRFEVDIPYSPNLRVTVPLIIGTEPFMELEPPKNSQTSGSGSNDILPDPEGEKTPSFRVPRFHLLNPKFQKRFPETFAARLPTPVGATDERKNKASHKPKCKCKNRSHRKKHRPCCSKWRGSESSSEFERGRSRGRGHTKRKSTGPVSHKVTTDFGFGIPLEECTYANWLAASVEDYDGERKGENNMLINVMKQYGLLSQMAI